jgi:hypothetical protein
MALAMEIGQLRHYVLLSLSDFLYQTERNIYYLVKFISAIGKTSIIPWLREKSSSVLLCLRIY